MFHHAMIAVDLTSQVPLLECAPDLRNWGVEKISLVYFLEVGYAHGPGFGAEERQREALDALAEPLRSQGLSVDIHVATSGDVGASLAERAGDSGADLLVVGNRSHNVLQRLFLGSVARKVLRRSTVPVLVEWIEPVGDDTGRCELTCAHTLRRVLVASDLSASARPVHDAAVALASLGTEVDLVHVASQDNHARFAEWSAMAEAALGEVHDRILAAGGSGEVTVVDGDPIEVLRRLSEERDLSLIVVGKGGGASSSPGSTARALSKQSGRPVLLIPNW